MPGFLDISLNFIVLISGHEANSLLELRSYMNIAYIFGVNRISSLFNLLSSKL